MRLLAAEQDRGDHPPHDQDEGTRIIPRSEPLPRLPRIKNGIDWNVRFQRPALLLVIVQNDGVDDFIQICFALENTHSGMIDGMQIENPIVTTPISDW